MAKQFIKITQTYHTIAIMDIDDNETKEEVLDRIKEYINDTDGGVETIIINGGEINFEYIPHFGEPTEEDELSYECID